MLMKKEIDLAPSRTGECTRRRSGSARRISCSSVASRSSLSRRYARFVLLGTGTVPCSRPRARLRPRGATELQRRLADSEAPRAVSRIDG